MLLGEATWVWKSGFWERGIHQCLSWDSETLPYLLGQKQLENTKNMLQGLGGFPVTAIFSSVPPKIFSLSHYRKEVGLFMTGT